MRMMGAAMPSRQHADQECRQSHQHDGDEEGVLSPDQVTEATEHQRAERAHRKTCGKGKQSEDESAGGIEC